MANTALKTSLKTDLIDLISSGLSNSNNYYLFVGRAVQHEDNTSTTIIESDVIPPSVSEVARNVYDTFRNIIFIKRINAGNIRIVVPRVDWTRGTIYTAYSETTDMAGKTFYVMTNEYNVYKCLAANGTSNVMPTGRASNSIRTSDGYVWKYIYTVPEEYLGFLTLEYMPIFVGNETTPEQRQVEISARYGSIDSVSFTASKGPTFGKLFGNERYITNVNSYLYPDFGVTANTAGSTYISFDISQENPSAGSSYWDGYAVHVTNGPGIGQYFRILSFHKAGSGVSYTYANVYPAVSSSLTALSDASTATASRMKVVPHIVVDGDGQDAVVIPTTDFNRRITAMTISNPGKNYTYAKPRVTTEASSVSLSSQIADFNASVSVSLSPPTGHGGNAIKELGAADLMIAADIEGTEGGKISTRNDYRQFGLIKNPYLYGGQTLAGFEEKIVSKMLLKRQPSKSGDYSSSIFPKGNFVIGRESKAIARIDDSESVPGSRFYRLFLTDIVGNFRFSDPVSNHVRVYRNADYSGTFATGDSAYQYEGAIGTTLSASGKVISFNNEERSLLLDTTYGSFVTGRTITFTTATPLGSTMIIDVDEEFGEQIGQFELGTTSGSEFTTFGGDEIFGRIASTRLSPTISEDIGEYNLTTRITVTSPNPLTDRQIVTGTNSADGTITQTDTITAKKVTGTIIDFRVEGGLGFTGVLHLSDVRGSYNTTNQLSFSAYGSTAETALTDISIHGITSPDIRIGSGDLLYIENVRPIERNIEQSEEFKIVIGF